MPTAAPTAAPFAAPLDACFVPGDSSRSPPPGSTSCSPAGLTRNDDMFSSRTPACLSRILAASASGATSKPPATIVVMVPPWVKKPSEAELHPGRREVHVAAAAGEVEVVAVPVRADRDVPGHVEGGADAVGGAPAALVAGVEERRRIRRDVGPAIDAASLREDGEAIADRNSGGEAQVGRPCPGVAARRLDLAELGVARLAAEDAVDVAARIHLPAGVA